MVCFKTLFVIIFEGVEREGNVLYIFNPSCFNKKKLRDFFVLFLFKNIMNVKKLKLI